MTDDSYARFEVSGDIKAKGIGMMSRKALVDYLDNHNFEYSIIDSSHTDSNFSVTFDLHDKGELDLLTQGFHDAMMTSGKQPTKSDKKPKITIRAIPREVTVNQVDADHQQWTQAFEALQKDKKDLEKLLKEKGAEVEVLSGYNAKKQEVIGKKDTQINTLKEQLANQPSKRYDTALEAMLNGLFPTYVPLHEEIGLDYLTMVDSSNLNALVDGIETLRGYFNKVTGSNYTKEEFKELQAIKNQAWEDSDTYLELSEKVAQAKSTISAYENMKATGADQRALDALKPVIDELKKENPQEKLEEQKEAYQQKLNDVTKVDEVKKEYKVLEEVSKSAQKRRSEGSQVTIISRGDNIYIPNTIKELSTYIKDISGAKQVEENERYLVLTSPRKGIKGIESFYSAFGIGIEYINMTPASFSDRFTEPTGLAHKPRTKKK